MIPFIILLFYNYISISAQEHNNQPPSAKEEFKVLLKESTKSSTFGKALFKNREELAGLFDAPSMSEEFFSFLDRDKDFSWDKFIELSYP